MTWLEHPDGAHETDTSDHHQHKGNDMHDDAKQILGLLNGVLRHQISELDQMDEFVANEALLHQAHGPGCACQQTLKKQRGYLKTQITDLLPTVETFNDLAARAGLPTLDDSRIRNSAQAALA